MNNKSSILENVNTKINLHTDSDNIVFVYCPPKVGSTSLVSSIRMSANHRFKVLHIHDEKMLEILTGIKDISIQDIIDYNASLGRNVIVIDIYREPLERKMSEFFGKLASYHFNTMTKNVENYSMDRIIKRFNLLFSHIGRGDHFLEKYRDIVANPPRSFDFTKKCLVQSVNNVTYVKLRLRDSSQWPSILEPVLGTKITIITDYERTNLPLGELYSQFKRHYKIPANFIQCVLADKDFYFYLSQEEQTKYIAKLESIKGPQSDDLTMSEYKIYATISDENQSVVDIETDHYFDDGCRCDICSKMRVVVLQQVKKGLRPITRMCHSDVLKTYKESKHLQYLSQAKPLAPPPLTPVQPAIQLRRISRKARFSMA